MWADREAEAHARRASGDPIERRAVNASSAWFLLDAGAIAAGARRHPGRTRHGRDFTDGPPRPSPACQPLAGPPPAARPAAAPAVPSVSLALLSRIAARKFVGARRRARLDIPASVRLPARHRLRRDGVQTSPRHPRDRWHGALTTTRARPRLRLPRIPEKFLQRAARQHARREIQLFSSESIS